MQLLLLSIHADSSPLDGALEFDLTLDERKDRVVVPDSSIRAGVELGAALANKNCARFHELAPVTLDP